MKFMKAFNIWQYGDMVRTGQIKLQKGQWVRLGPDGTLSRYHSSTKNHITAFHYPNATKKFLTYNDRVKG
jgi:hypothetical protein